MQKRVEFIRTMQCSAVQHLATNLSRLWSMRYEENTKSISVTVEIAFRMSRPHSMLDDDGITPSLIAR